MVTVKTQELGTSCLFKASEYLLSHFYPLTEDGCGSHPSGKGHYRKSSCGLCSSGLGSLTVGMREGGGEQQSQLGAAGWWS